MASPISSIRHTGGVLLTALTLCLAGSAQPASAQGLFKPCSAASTACPRACPANQLIRRSAWPVRQSAAGRRSQRFGHGMVYCVRTCDGRYFPLQRHAGTSPAEQCKSFCPAAKTMVFSGSKIDTAVAQNGTRYADLDNAFAYRDKVSDGCSCNARTGSGSPASTQLPIRRCVRATSLRPTTALPPTMARAGPQNSHRSTPRRANGPADCPR